MRSILLASASLLLVTSTSSRRSGGSPRRRLNSAEAFDPDFRLSSTVNRTLLREALLDGYDPMVPPESDRSASGTSYSGAGTDVTMEIRFLKVVTVRAAEGAMVVKVWVRMGWQDLRLSWDPAAYGGLTEVFFAGNEAQEFFSSEVWVPDIQPYNGIQGTTMSLEPSPVRVSNDGSVFWSRPGVLDVMCKFSGLAAFPFDNLLCAIELGGYSYSGGYQGIILKGGKGIEHSLQEVTTGTSYQEFDIVNITSTVNRYTYPDYPSEPWDVAVYYVMLRSHHHLPGGPRHLPLLCRLLHKDRVGRPARLRHRRHRGRPARQSRAHRHAAGVRRAALDRHVHAAQRNVLLHLSL
jgi:hypothetical protein